MPEQIIQSRKLTLDFSRPYTIIKTQFNYSAAEDMALEFVYKLAPCIADKLNIDTGNVILIAISKNNKVVIFCENSRYRDWLYNFFEQPSLGSAQFYDDVDPALIIEKLDILFEHSLIHRIPLLVIRCFYAPIRTTHNITPVPVHYVLPILYLLSLSYAPTLPPYQPCTYRPAPLPLCSPCKKIKTKTLLHFKFIFFYVIIGRKEKKRNPE